MANALTTLIRKTADEDNNYTYNMIASNVDGLPIITINSTNNPTETLTFKIDSNIHGDIILEQVQQ